MSLRLKDGYNFIKEEGLFFNRLYQMVKTKEPDLPVQKKEKTKLKKAYYLMTIETLDKIASVSLLKKIFSYVNEYLIRNPSLIMEPTRPLQTINAHLLKEFQTQNTHEVILSVIEQTNLNYNSHLTNEEIWLEIKTEFLKYCFRNHQELEELKSMENNARSFGIELLVKEIKKTYEKLVAEEKELSEIVKSLDPENCTVSGHEIELRKNYNETLKLIQEKTRLYGKYGRTPFLRAYNERKNERNKTDEEETARQLIFISEHESKEELQSGVESLTLSARKFRQEPQKVIKSANVIKTADRDIRDIR